MRFTSVGVGTGRLDSTDTSSLTSHVLISFSSTMVTVVVSRSYLRLYSVIDASSYENHGYDNYTRRDGDGYDVGYEVYDKHNNMYGDGLGSG